MKRLFTSFYVKISVVFLVLLMLVGAVLIYVTWQASDQYFSDADQALHQRLGRDMAKEFSPFLQDSIQFAEIMHQIHYMMVINPKIEI